MPQARPVYYLRAAFGCAPLDPYAHWSDTVGVDVPAGWWEKGATLDRTGHSPGVVAGAVGVVDRGPLPLTPATTFGGAGSIDIADTGFLRFSPDLTVEAWVNPNSAGGGAIFSTWMTGPVPAYRLSIDAGRPRLSIWNAAGTEQFVRAATALPIGEYSHVVGTYHPGANGLRMFVNGVEVATTTTSITVRSGVGGSYIGRDAFGNFFDGGIGDVAAYSFALSAARVLAHYQSGWTDLSARIRLDASHYWNRGRRKLLERFEAGDAAWILDNRDGQLDPLNYAAVDPYVNKTLPNVPIEFGVFWQPPAGGIRTRTPLWTGYADSWTPDYSGRDAVVTLKASGGLKHFAVDGPATPLEAEIMADNPGAWWRFGGYDPTADGPIMSDSTPNNRDGRLPNNLAAGSSVAPFGGGASIALPANDSSYGYQRDETIYALPFTLAGWFQADPGFNSTGGGLLEITNSDGASIGAANVDLVFADFTSLHGIDGGGPNCFFEILITSTTGNASWMNTSFTVDDGRPHAFMVAITSPTNWQLFVDGAPVYGDIFNNGVAGGLTGLDQIKVGGLRTATDDQNVALGLSDLAVFPGVALDVNRAYAHYIAGRFGWDGDRSGERIRRIIRLLDSEAFTGSISVDSIDTPLAFGEDGVDDGNTILQGSTLDGSLLEHMQRVAATEAAGLYETRLGRIRFRQRHALWSRTPYTVIQATFGDRSADLRYEKLVPVLDYSRLITKAVIGRRGSTPQTSENEVARRLYGPRKAEATDLLMQNDNYATDYANWLVARYGDPRREFESIVIAPGAGDDAVTAAYLALELEYLIWVNKHTVNGDPYGYAAHIQSDYNTLENGVWRTTMYLTAQDGTPYFQLGNGVTGKLNGGYALAY